MSGSIMSRAGLRPARLIAFLAVVLYVTFAWGLDVPPLTGRVVDLAHVLPADVAASLADDLQAHETKTTDQVAVLILPSLEGEPLEEFSHRVATTWTLGQKGTDNGVLLIVAIKDRKVRIEVGYGLEGTLTDARSAQIMRNEIVPRFRAGDLPGGVAAGVHAVLGTIEGTYQAESRPVQIRAGPEPTGLQYLMIGVIVGTVTGLVMSHRRQSRALFGSGLAFLVSLFGGLIIGLGAAAITTVVLLVLLNIDGGGPRLRRRGWGPDFSWGPGVGSGGESFGSGGFSGGGGSFGGGGASGSW
jgi:uncharacterized protein